MVDTIRFYGPYNSASGADIIAALSGANLISTSGSTLIIPGANGMQVSFLNIQQK